MRRLRRTNSVLAHGRTTSSSTVKYGRLEACTRAVQAANAEWVAASAVVETTELAFENALLAIDDVLARVDPAHVALPAQRTPSPGGFMAIGALGSASLDLLPRLRSQLARFANHGDVAAERGKLDQAEAQFRAALAAEKKAQTKVELALAAELEADNEFGGPLTAPGGELGESPSVPPQRVKHYTVLRQGRKVAGRRAG